MKKTKSKEQAEEFAIDDAIMRSKIVNERMEMSSPQELSLIHI